MEETSELDELSLKVIALLQADGRISIRELAKRLGVAPATVRARYNQLCDDGTIQIVAAPNPRKLGLHFHALVAARLEPGKLEPAVAILEKKPEVAWIGLTLNEYGVLFEVVVRDAQVFGEYKEKLLAELPGYISADVNVIWDVRKFHYTLVPPETPKRRSAIAEDVPSKVKARKAKTKTPRTNLSKTKTNEAAVKRSAAAQN